MPTWLTKELIIDVVICVFFFSLGYGVKVKLDEAADDLKEKAAIEAQHKAQDEANSKAATWEAARMALEAENQHLKGRLANEIKKAVYHTCVVPVDGVRIFNDALSGNGPGKPDVAVPGH